MKKFISTLVFSFFAFIVYTDSVGSPLTITIKNDYQDIVEFQVEKGNEYVSLPNHFYLQRGQSITAKVHRDQIMPICKKYDVPFTTSTYVAFYDTSNPDKGSTNEGYFGIGLACENNHLEASMNGLNGRGFNIFTENGRKATLIIASSSPTS